MKSKIIITTAVTVAVILLSVSVSWAGHSYHDRLNRQERRIEQGLRSGEITHREYVRLHNELDRIRYEIRKSRRHHGFDRHERRRIERMLDRSSERIYRAKHNHVDRYKYRKPYRKHHYRGPNYHKYGRYGHGHRRDSHRYDRRPWIRGTVVLPIPLPPPPPPFFVRR